MSSALLEVLVEVLVARGSVTVAIGLEVDLLVGKRLGPLGVPVFTTTIAWPHWPGVPESVSSSETSE
jgi:hypothetical protein